MKLRHTTLLRVGFVPLVDCAPLVIAKELGYFAKYGLNVALHREVGWATVRDKLICGELDAAQAVAGLVFAASWGLAPLQGHCETALVLNLNGNAITLSSELWDRGVRDAASLGRHIAAERESKTLTFGVVSPFSSHTFLLRQWLQSGGINPDRDVRLLVALPQQMPGHLKAGHLDGYCVGEPWNSVAVQARLGWCPATSSQLAPLHPEKVLMVRAEFARHRAPEHIAMVAALREACVFCDRVENREMLIKFLNKPMYLNTLPRALRASLQPQFDFGNERIETVPDFHVFHRHNANEPTAAKAEWVVEQLRQCGVFGAGAQPPSSLGAELFRADIFAKATQLMQEKNERTTEPAYDGVFAGVTA